MCAVRFGEQSSYCAGDLRLLADRARAFRSPLACVAHIDMNAFFAQCEQHRLGLSWDDPVVCVQWDTIIAVSYAAREFGVSRLDRLAEAKQKCPGLILAHTAVFRRGQPVWKYVDYVPSPADHKVSLDPYRRESRKIMSVFSQNCDLIEKASVDECFLDLGRLVYARVCELFPEVARFIETAAANEPLPVIGEIPADLVFKGHIIPNAQDDLTGSNAQDGGAQNTFSICDWDDVVILIGSNICYDLRMKIKDILGYRTSGGVARVKTMAKLASDFKKPDQQTIIRNGSIGTFLKNFQITDFWSLGGKTGQFIKERLGDGDLIAKIRRYDTVDELYEYFPATQDKELCDKLFKIVRGELFVPLDPKEIVKSMSANKNFRGRAVNSATGFEPWLRVFVGELILRLKEMDEERGLMIRPTKLTLFFASSLRSSHTKQCTLSIIKDFQQLDQVLWEQSLKLVNDLVRNLKLEMPQLPLFPLRNASLTVSGLVESSGVNTIDELLQKNVKRRPGIPMTSVSPPPSTDQQEQKLAIPETSSRNKRTLDSLFKGPKMEPVSSDDPIQEIPIPVNDLTEEDKIQSENDSSLVCTACGKPITADEWVSHQDYHLALELDEKYNKPFESSTTIEKMFERKKRKLPPPGQRQLDSFK